MPITTDEKQDLEVDDTRLDEALARQPGLTFKWSEIEADCQHTLSTAKGRLAICEARLELKVRADPESFGLDKKPPADAVKAAVRASEEWELALKEVNAAEYELDCVKAMVSGITDKRRALERRVELLAINYFAEPRPRIAGGPGLVQEVKKGAARGPVRRVGGKADGDQ